MIIHETYYIMKIIGTSPMSYDTSQQNIQYYLSCSLNLNFWMASVKWVKCFYGLKNGFA